VVEVPALLQAARGIPGGRADNQQGDDQPQADMHLGKAGEAETDPQRSEGKHYAAGEGFSPQFEDGDAEGHKLQV